MTKRSESQIKSEIINRVKSIQAQKEAKKAMASSYSESIKQLEEEKQTLLVELEQVHQQHLTEQADEILDAEVDQ